MSSTPPRKKPEELRSQQWFGRQDRDGFAYRSWVKGKGVPHDQFDGRPVIGICNTFSELTPCNSHFRTLAEQVKIGVYEAGGFPLEFPVMSLCRVTLFWGDGSGLKRRALFPGSERLSPKMKRPLMGSAVAVWSVAARKNEARKNDWTSTVA